MQDKIYKFIKDICKNNFSTIKDINKVALLINKYVVKNDKIDGMHNFLLKSFENIQNFFIKCVNYFNCIF